MYFSHHAISLMCIFRESLLYQIQVQEDIIGTIGVTIVVESTIA